jgi:hypothetical protein
MVAYLAVKSRNSKTAENLIIFGAIWTVFGLVFYVALAGFIFGLLSR